MKTLRYFRVFVCVGGWVGGCGEGYIGHVNTISFLAVLVLYLRSVGSKRG